MLGSYTTNPRLVDQPAGLAVIRGRWKVDAGSEHLIEVFWAAASDTVTLWDSSGTTLTPSFVGALCWASGSTAVRVAHVLLALSRALSPQGLLLALSRAGAVRDVAYGVTHILLAVRVVLVSAGRYKTLLFTGRVVAHFKVILVLLATVVGLPALESAAALCWTLWFLVETLGVPSVLLTGPWTCCLLPGTVLALGFTGRVVAVFHAAVLGAVRVLHLPAEVLAALGGTRQVALLPVTVLLTAWIRLSSLVGHLTACRAGPVAFIQVGIIFGTRLI